MATHGLKILALALCAVLTASCAGLDQRIKTATAVAAGGGLVRGDAPGGAFVLATWSRISDSRAPLTVYLEGDGLAWLTATEVSADPTPTDPVALRLAALDRGPNVVYIARPCQFGPPAGTTPCSADVWARRPFAPPVISAVDRVVDLYAARTSRKVRLVGYSGGGAVAVLSAAGRGDVVDLRTVAANLSTGRFTAYHKVSPYEGSADPAHAAMRLSRLPQIHFVGARDRTVPRLIAEDYAARAGAGACVEIVEAALADHSRGWTEAWPELSVRTPRCPP